MALRRVCAGVLLMCSLLLSWAPAAAVEFYPTCPPGGKYPLACRVFEATEGEYAGRVEPMTSYTLHASDVNEAMTLMQEYLDEIPASPYGVVDTREPAFGDQHVWRVVIPPGPPPGEVFAILSIRVENVVTRWEIKGKDFDVFALASAIFASMDTTFASSGQSADFLLPRLEDMPDGFILAEQHYHMLEGQEIASRGRQSSPQPTARAKPTSVPVTSARGDIDRQTVEIMNNLDQYRNTRITIRGEIYIIDVVNDQTVFVMTDEETYFFNVVYDGELPGLAPGDTVVVTGLLLDRTVQGSPLVQASSVYVD